MGKRCYFIHHVLNLNELKNAKMKKRTEYFVRPLFGWPPTRQCPEKNDFPQEAGKQGAHNGTMSRIGSNYTLMFKNITTNELPLEYCP